MLTYTASFEYNGVTYTNSDYTEPIPKTSYSVLLGTKGYAYLKDALDDAAEGDTVILIADVDEPNADCGGYPYYFNAITLDLNGHTATVKNLTMSNNITIKNGIHFTIQIHNERVRNSIFQVFGENQKNPHKKTLTEITDAISIRVFLVYNVFNSVI